MFFKDVIKWTLEDTHVKVHFIGNRKANENESGTEVLCLSHLVTHNYDRM